MSGVISAFPQPNPFPTNASLGVVAQSYPCIGATAGSAALVSGQIYLTRIVLGTGQTTVTNIMCGLQALGTTLTAGQCFAGVYDQNGSQIGITADQAANWQTPSVVGLKTIPLAGGPFTGSWPFVYVAILANGTTGPAFSRGSGAVIGSSPPPPQGPRGDNPLFPQGSRGAPPPRRLHYPGHPPARHPPPNSGRVSLPR